MSQAAEPDVTTAPQQANAQGRRKRTQKKPNVEQKRMSVGDGTDTTISEKSLTQRLNQDDSSEAGNDDYYHSTQMYAGGQGQAQGQGQLQAGFSSQESQQSPAQQQQQGGGQAEKKEGGGKSDKGNLSLRLDLNLDIELQLKAKIQGDLTLSLLG